MMKGSRARTDLNLTRQLLTLVPWRMRWRIALLLLAALFAALLDLVSVLALLPLMEMLTAAGRIPPVVSRVVVPLVGSDDRQMLLLVLALIIGLGFLVKNLSLIGIRWWSIGETTRATAAAQATLIRRYTAASYISHRRRSKSVILQTVTGAVPMAFTAVVLGYISLAVDSMTILLLFCSLVVLSPLGSGAAILLFGGAALLLAGVLKPRARRCADEALRLGTESWSSLSPAIEGFRETRLFGREALFAHRYASNRSEAARVGRAQSMLVELPKYLLEMVMILGIITIALLLFASHDEQEAFGLLAVFAAASIRIVPALNRTVATVNGIRAGQPSLDLVAEQIAELGDSAPESTDTAGDEKPLRGDIEVRDLGFCYPDASAPVLSGVNVRIRAGSTVAVVGSSGAGKTTFVDILVGLFTPAQGRVTVGGHDITAEPGRWRRSVAMVSQKVFLWDASIRDLVTFGEPTDQVDEARLSAAISDAGLADLVQQLPDGLDSRVGDSGARVSGGQAQRIGIARALYAQPQALVLDEATSALDNETEHQITTTIERLKGRATVIVVAHRLSTVRNADEILFFSGGRLKARGTMAQLRDSEPEFARMVELGSLT